MMARLEENVQLKILTTQCEHECATVSVYSGEPEGYALESQAINVVVKRIK